MNREAVQAHFDAMVGKLLKRMPKADRGAFRHVVIDSYEVGPENWTDGFGEQFHKVYGYDPKPWLPVLTGRIIGSADQSDRFLWDLRRLVADRIATDYVGVLRDACHAHGLRLWLENYGHWGFPAEFLQYGGQSDDLGGEFWVSGGPTVNLGSVELRAASSAAHLYGKQVVSAEAFTSGRSFHDYPAGIKALGDWAYCQGINHFVLHVYIHQPWQDRRPGVNAWFGTEFNRHNTWFEQAKAWIDYLRRCHFLLQQGRAVNEIAYFIGEDAPKMTGTLQPKLPAGYDYDFINGELLLKAARVENGRIAVGQDASYRVLVLPPLETMRPELLRKIRDLVVAGATIIGPAPRRSPSLQNYPACDNEIAQLAAQIWGNCDGKQSTERTVGQGRVFCGIDLAEAMKRLGATPAVVVPNDIRWTHRSTEDGDIFFLSNQTTRPRLVEASFRVSGVVPEIWRAESGRIERTAWYSTEGGRMNIPVALDPDGSAFVVFRKAAPSPAVVGIERNGKPLQSDGVPCPIQVDRTTEGGLTAVVSQPGAYALRKTDGKQLTVDAASLPLPIGIAGPWKLRFPASSGAAAELDLQQLIPWQTHSNPNVRFFSGTAAYETTLHIPAELLGDGRRLTLDLGRVEVVAEVRLNGKDLGTLWKPPYAIDITDAAKPGANSLEIKVTNNWWNRLVGDANLPEEKRTTFTTTKPPAPRVGLLPSGLIGPVRLLPAREIRFSDAEAK
jgi:hypothetical protein